MQNLSPSQKKALLSNPNVEKITDKHVVYTSSFKTKAVEDYLNGKSPNQIFLDSGIDPTFFVTKYCQSCIKRWKKKYVSEGKSSLKKDKRGLSATGRPKREHPDDLTIEELRAIVEVQRDLIDHLTKKRALAKSKKN